ncbi:protein rolling stone-like [Stylophora pistillata]|uniref:Protein rolling stone n=1 Tax=Stylophora pistillata TaxID=50429 RepID=A0A2B4SA76_STYPI|nr:protein rolling stone-like [Stylophora pistillata]XP_022790885.1 protein rolling stone-like [Stylophora pistillata]PFX25487.1 Protein rolling stone [Stylophora pistillata]
MILFNDWFIWLSNWSFYLVSVYFITATIVTAVHYNRDRRTKGNNAIHDEKDPGGDSFKEMNDRTSESKGDINIHLKGGSNVNSKDAEVIFTAGSQSPSVTPMAWFHEALWVIYNIAANAALLVTISFWTLIYGLGINNKVTPYGIVVHVINSIVIIADTILTSMPVRLLHIVYPMLYSITYIIFTVIYWASGDGMRYVYPQTDYTGRPVFSALSIVGLLLIGLPLCQIIFFCFYRIRVWMKARWGLCSS